MKGNWPYIFCFIECCFQYLLKTTHSILVLFPFNFFSACFVSNYLLHPYSSINTVTDWNKSHFILSDRTDIHMILWLLKASQAFPKEMWTLLTVDEVLPLSYEILATNCQCQLLKVNMVPFELTNRKYTYTHS